MLPPVDSWILEVNDLLTRNFDVYHVFNITLARHINTLRTIRL